MNSKAPTNENKSISSTFNRKFQSMKKEWKETNKISFFFLCIIAFIFLIPFLWMLSTAFKTSGEAMSGDTNFIPRTFTWENFQELFQVVPYMDYLVNSIIVAFFAVILTVFINLLAGYAFAKYKFRGRNILFVLVLATLMVPAHIIVLPNFFILNELGWINTYAGLIIPTAAEAFGLFLARQYMLSIPDEMIRAARVDGAGEFKIFLKIILPNVQPLIAILIIFTFMFRWNDLIYPLVVSTDSSMYTLPVGMVMAEGEYFVDWTLMMSMTLISIIPILIVFFIFQRHFVQGFANTGMKE